MCRILYRLLVSLARLAVRSGRSKGLEIIVLRHQLTVLHRQSNRPGVADEDRALLGAIAAVLSRRQRACGCRKLCRGWSGGISVLVDESAAAGRSNDLEVSVWLVWWVGGDGWSLVE